jgi:hypothetical protein
LYRAYFFFAIVFAQYSDEAFFSNKKTGDAFLAENISCDKTYGAVEVCCIFAYCVLLFQQAPKRFAAFHGFRRFQLSAHSRAKKL